MSTPASTIDQPSSEHLDLLQQQADFEKRIEHFFTARNTERMNQTQEFVAFAAELFQKLRLGKIHPSKLHRHVVKHALNHKDNLENIPWQEIIRQAPNIPKSTVDTLATPTQPRPSPTPRSPVPGIRKSTQTSKPEIQFLPAAAATHPAVPHTHSSETHRRSLRTKQQRRDMTPPTLNTRTGKEKAESPESRKRQKADHPAKRRRLDTPEESDLEIDQLQDDIHEAHGKKDRKPCWGNYVGQLPKSLQGPCSICTQRDLPCLSVELRPNGTVCDVCRKQKQTCTLAKPRKTFFGTKEGKSWLSAHTPHAPPEDEPKARSVVVTAAPAKGGTPMAAAAAITPAAGSSKSVSSIPTIVIKPRPKVLLTHHGFPGSTHHTHAHDSSSRTSPELEENITDEYAQFLSLPTEHEQVQFLGNLLTRRGSEHKALWAETDRLREDFTNLASDKPTSSLNTSSQDLVAGLVQEVKSLTGRVADLESAIQRERIARQADSRLATLAHQSLSQIVNRIQRYPVASQPRYFAAENIYGLNASAGNSYGMTSNTSSSGAKVKTVGPKEEQDHTVNPNARSKDLLTADTSRGQCLEDEETGKVSANDPAAAAATVPSRADNTQVSPAAILANPALNSEHHQEDLISTSTQEEPKVLVESATAATPTFDTLTSIPPIATLDP